MEDKTRKFYYQKLMEQYPRQGRAIEENIRLLSEAEQQNQKDIDYVSGLTGRFLAECFWLLQRNWNF